MSRMRLIALAGAVVCAVLAGMLMRSMTARKAQPIEAQVAKVETSQILVADKDLAMGDRLSGAVVWKPWPKDSVLPSMITKEAKPNAMEELAHARTRGGTFKSEPIFEKRIVIPGAGGFISAILPKGMRAKSIKIASNTAAGGFILPNDRVDVILTRRAVVSGSSAQAAVSETVLTNGRVLAVNNVIKPAADGDPTAIDRFDTATLELTPLQAEVLTNIEAQGELTLVLRSIADNDGIAPEKLVPELAGRYAGKEDVKKAMPDTLFIRDGVASTVAAH